MPCLWIVRRKHPPERDRQQGEPVRRANGDKTRGGDQQQRGMLSLLRLGARRWTAKTNTNRDGAKEEATRLLLLVREAQG
ncbi:glycosyl hydrolase [Sesbania bispinosa]|nr:glycosyl hydrolase [Sesbania bispinosa]